MQFNRKWASPAKLSLHVNIRVSGNSCGLKWFFSRKFTFYRKILSLIYLDILFTFLFQFSFLGKICSSPTSASWAESGSGFGFERHLRLHQRIFPAAHVRRPPQEPQPRPWPLHPSSISLKCSGLFHHFRPFGWRVFNRYFSFLLFRLGNFM